MTAPERAQSGALAEDSDEPLRVLHVISGLGTGGAENFLLRLLTSLRGKRTVARVVSLGQGGGMVERYREAGVDLSELGLISYRHWGRAPRAMARLITEVREWRPKVIQGWMNHGNVAAWLARVFSASDAKLIWSVRQSVCDLALEKPGTRLALRLQSAISGRPDAIVCNSHQGLLRHVDLGFRSERMQVIPNGFDPDLFQPRPEWRSAARAALGVAPDAFVVAMVARNHPKKDYGTFVDAVALAVKRIPRLHAVCVGPSADSSSVLTNQIARLGITGRCTLLGERQRLERLYPGVDLVCLTSAWGEGFPNVVGEAMACGVPCAVTDCGDAAVIVGDTGRVIRSRSPEDAANAMVEFEAMGHEARRLLGLRARARVIAEYSLPVIAARYFELYESLLGERAQAAPLGEREPTRADEHAPV